MNNKQVITKIVRIGTIMEWHTTKELPTDVYCKIEFSNDNTLSITGVIGPKSNGDCWGSCGQISMGFEHKNPEQNDKRYRKLITPYDIDFAPYWGTDLWYGFLNIWSLYHLNDLKSNCEHQELMGITYDTNCHHVCPVCGYKIGSAWLRRDIPKSVIEFLCALPDADKTPAWV